MGQVPTRGSTYVLYGIVSERHCEHVLDRRVLPAVIACPCDCFPFVCGGDGSECNAAAAAAEMGKTQKQTKMIVARSDPNHSCTQELT